MSSNFASRGQGVHGSGGRAYPPDMADRLLGILLSECVGPCNRKTVEEIAGRLNLNGRATRDIVRDLELAELVLTDFSEGYYVCETVAQAERATRRLQSQVGHMQERIDARQRMTERLRQ